MKKVVILSGPTGVGKTRLSLDLAKRLNAEIISADSMQIYRGMDIGTDKIRKDQMEGISHHMLSIIDPDERFSVQNFQKLAYQIIDDIHSRGKTPLIVGGTGLYIDSIFYDYDFSEVKPNREFRRRMDEEYKRNPQKLLDRVQKINPKQYGKLNLKDKKKIIRALEVYEFSGKSTTQNQSKSSKYDISLFVLNDDRQKLYDRINKRVERLLEMGLIGEVEGLLSRTPRDSQSMKAIGYKEVINYLDGLWDYETMVAKLKQNTRKYAKRQLTWFRRNPQAIWLDKEKLTDQEIIEIIVEEVK